MRITIAVGMLLLKPIWFLVFLLVVFFIIRVGRRQTVKRSWLFGGARRSNRRGSWGALRRARAFYRPLAVSQLDPVRGLTRKDRVTSRAPEVA
jgi:hypothetical protein